jgi:hypothetical protein
VLALPASSDCGGVSCRYVARDLDIDGSFEDLVLRTKKSSGSNKAVVAAAVSKVQKAQSDRSKTKEEKKTVNKKTVQTASNSPAVKDAAKAYREKAKADPKVSTKEMNAKSDKLKAGAKSRAVTNAVKEKKVERTKAHEANKKTPDQKAATKAAQTERRKDRKAAGVAPGPKTTPKKESTALDKKQKHNVKQQFQSAATKLKNTQGLPARKDKVKVGSSTTDGRAARQGAFNTYLHSKTPVGRNPINKQPKTFKNAPYPKDHKETALQGKKALPQNGKEYPVINNSPNGYTATNGKPGPLRTVTYKKGGQRHAAVIGHDAKRDPAHKDEHYVATKA